MNRSIIHIDVTDFYIQIERVLEPKLSSRPLAIAIETATRSIIFSSSVEARQNGIFRGMPVAQAKKQCPDLRILPPNEELYARGMDALINIFGQFTPIFEPLRFGHAYLDMTGSDRLFGGMKDAAAKMQKEINQRLQLEASAGVASNKLVSKVASSYITNIGDKFGLCNVRFGDEEPFLAPLKIGYLPGVEKKIRQELIDLNVRIIRELAMISAEHLQTVFGKFGILLHQRARGIDNRPVQPLKHSPEIVELENLTEDSNDFYLLRSKVFLMLSRIVHRLRSDNIQTKRIVVTIHYSDYKEDTVQKKCPGTNNEIELASVVEEIFEKALSRRVRVRKIVLKAADLCKESKQLFLFENNINQKDKAVAVAIEKIKNRFGQNSIQFGRAF